VHYINQFYGGVGGEEKADYPPEAKAGATGPGIALDALFDREAEIVGTIICGDSYFNERLEEARSEVLHLAKSFRPDVFVAGPAFNAGRYGMACGHVCKAVSEALSIPALTSMFEENPGVESFQKDVYILKTGRSAASMRTAAAALAAFALKLGKGEAIRSAEEDDYFPRGVRKNVFRPERGSKRAVDMLIRKIKGEPYTTEYPMPVFDYVPPNPAVKAIRRARIALVTSGGIVPKGNPDRIESSSASKYGKYSIASCVGLTDSTHETAHGGYDPVYANQDADRVLPVDVLRDLENEGLIGKLHEYYYATVGNGTSVANAKGFAAEFAVELRNDGVDAVILTST